MPTTTTSRGATRTELGADRAFLLLRTVFTVAAILFGLDKFTNLLTDWERSSRRGSTASCPATPGRP